MTSVLDRATVQSSSDHFVGRKYVQLVLVLGALSAIGPLTIDTYLPALPELTTDLAATDSHAQLTITGLLVGLGIGQLIIGPWSDVVGRRKPLLLGLAAHGFISLICAVAPSIELLIFTRILQGLCGAAVAVVAMATVRDLFSGVRAAQLLSRLILVLGIAPIVAPSLGSALLQVTSWRGIFVVLAMAAVGLLAVAWFGLPETLPYARRRPGSVRGSLRAYGALFSDRLFLIMVGIAGLMFATLFAYIAAAPFLLQEVFGLSTQQFGVAFGSTAVGLILMTQLNPILLRRYSPVRVLTAGVVLAFLSALTLLATAVTGFGGLLGVMIPLWFVMSCCGLSFPNAPAIALSRHGEEAGTAAALLGAAQFVIGGAVAPVVGAFANGTPVPMAAIVVATTGLAATLILLGGRRLDAASSATA
jgi:DHA1 family bicyclomycin/chloramphenicol resistance-like MFS transporter